MGSDKYKKLPHLSGSFSYSAFGSNTERRVSPAELTDITHKKIIIVGAAIYTKLCDRYFFAYDNMLPHAGSGG